MSDLLEEARREMRIFERVSLKTAGELCAEIERLRDLLERAEPFTPNGLDSEGEPTLLGNQIRAALAGKEIKP